MSCRHEDGEGEKLEEDIHAVCRIPKPCNLLYSVARLIVSAPWLHRTAYSLPRLQDSGPSPG